ncbi:MAG: hypothetical protein L6R41_004498 [Letrouitia leprolyta]|nr:MAG: hypothetical protein L6R41_004498 [Letrouitia leprolyta]
MIPALPFSWNGSPTFKTVSGKSTCFVKNVKITVTANKTRILLDPPANQTVVTETLVELLQLNSNLIARVNGGQDTIKDTFNIYGQLCISSNASVAKHTETLQYSYVDAAVEAGYATFSYDRIGVGKSQHPDPLQVVQGPIQVEIAHALVTQIRNAQIGPYSFENVVGVGHSAGSTVTQGVTTKYPGDLDAVILTGTSISPDFVNTALASFDLSIANLDPSGKFAGLPNGYLVQPNQQSIQFPYFRFPNIDPQILAIALGNKQTQTFGELFTLGSIVAPSPQFHGPVDVLLGENDLVFCGGDCTKPQDQSVLVAPLFYPAASGSQHYIVPGAGHNIFAHHSAREAFAQMIEFLKTNGL